VCPFGIKPLQVGQIMFLLIAPRNRDREKTHLPVPRQASQILARTLGTWLLCVMILSFLSPFLVDK
jgi:hypothetical protein